MPSFQPIELFWQHGKQYVSLNFELGRKMHEVWRQIRKGWYGDKDWKGKEGGWQAADCSKLVAHAIGEVNKWIAARGGSLRGTIGALEVSDSYDTDDVSKDEGRMVWRRRWNGMKLSGKGMMMMVVVMKLFHRVVSRIFFEDNCECTKLSSTSKQFPTDDGCVVVLLYCVFYGVASEPLQFHIDDGTLCCVLGGGQGWGG